VQLKLSSFYHLLSPADAIIGGWLPGSDFVVGEASTGHNAGQVNTFAGGPEQLINGSYGSGKHLNFGITNTGVLITPALGSTIVQSMTLWTANDSPARDPASYALYGTNSTISGGAVFDTFAITDFTLIQSGGLALPAARNGAADASIGSAPFSVGNRETVSITNTAAYTSYLLIFPTVKDGGAANSMQIAEVAFEGTLIPEPSTAFLGLFGALLMLRRRR